MTQISSSVLPTDDPGDNTTGTKINRSWVTALKAAIDTLIHSASNAAVTPANVIDEVVTARGSKSSLNARLNVTLNADGTPISSVALTDVIAEVTTARGASANLDARLDLINAAILGAEGSKATIDERLDIALAADGYIVSPYPKQLFTNIGLSTVTGKVAVKVNTGVTNVACSGAAETTLASKTISANLLDTNGDVLRCVLWGSIAANANTKTIKCKFGSATITVLASALGSAAAIWFVEFLIIRGTSVTQALVANINHNQKGANNPDPVRGTATEDLATDVTLSITGQGGASNDIIMDGFVCYSI